MVSNMAIGGTTKAANIESSAMLGEARPYYYARGAKVFMTRAKVVAANAEILTREKIPASTGDHVGKGLFPKSTAWRVLWPDLEPRPT